ncbi:MAG: hypothetical protein KDB63_08080 [Nocardioidaceae bacterium]|nr:hypothetical protein [Nocardioidaceae bacterium]
MNRWYERPEGEPMLLRKVPRLASWNKSSDPDQVRLREYLEDTAELVAASRLDEPWALRLDVGLPADRDLIDMADLDNYAFPLAMYLQTDDLVSVWCSKRHSPTSSVLMAPVRESGPPESVFTVRTTASAQTTAYKEQVRTAVAGAAELPAGAVQLQISFAVGPSRNWLNLWKPTIDALDPLLGATSPGRAWHPKDGRITDLGLHLCVDADLGNQVLVAIAAEPAG